MSCRCRVLRVSAAFAERLVPIGAALLGIAMSVAAPASAGELPTVTCPSDLTNCTADDLRSTVVAAELLNGDICDSLNDTLDVRITVEFDSTAATRYDVGVFVSSDGGTVQEPSTAVLCGGGAPLVGEGNLNADLTDPDTDLFLNEEGTGDTCGDVKKTAGPVQWTFDTTVKCTIDPVAHTLTVPSCRVWDHQALIDCTGLGQAGTGSKCDCSDLVVTAHINPCATTICNDNNSCTDDSCIVIREEDQPPVAQCVYTPNDENSCSDSNACTAADHCESGTCVGTLISCDDGNACTDDSCNPASGCVHTNDDTNTCGDRSETDCKNPDICDDGVCLPNDEAAGAPCTSDGNECTDDLCNASAVCVHTNDDTNTCSDGDACTTDACQDGTCIGTPIICDDSKECTDDECNPEDGQCVFTPDDSFCDDDNVCTEDGCDPQTGDPLTGCVNDPDPLVGTECEDPLCIFGGLCDRTGDCVCQQPFVCRTAGFWSTHAGVEKPQSRNITLEVLNYQAGDPVICGEVINNTTLKSLTSALEALCVSPQGQQELQLARQLTAMSLNCVMSGGGSDCSLTVNFADFTTCNELCEEFVVNADPFINPTPADVSACTARIDCLNNGGVPDDLDQVPGTCILGTCSLAGTPCGGNQDCPIGETCDTDPDSCHLRPLEFVGPPPLDFEPPGPAGSSKACNDAIRNTCTVFSLSCP